MSYYTIVDVQVDDMDEYRKYMDAARPLIEAAGGEYVIRGGATTVIEGTGLQPTRLVVLRFENEARFKAWYESDAYQEARKIRLPVSTMSMVGVEGADS